MNSIWNNNIALFKKRFPALAPLVPPEPPEPLYDLSPSRSGGISASTNGRALHSQYNPVRESQQLVRSNRSGETCSAAFFSFGLGYAPVEWAKQYPSDTLILIEPSPAHFFFALSVLDWTSVFSIPSCVLALAAEPAEVCALIEKYGGYDHCAMLLNATQMSHASDYYASLVDAIDRAKKKTIINSFTLEKFSHLWLKNSCKNLACFPHLGGITRFENKCPPSLPALILAAGPTLEEILPHLAELKKRTILIAVDTALRACLKAGVEPDFIVLVDPQYWAWRHLAGLSSPSSILITESAAYPSVYRFTCREIIQCASLFPLGKYFEKRLGSRGVLEAGGSVSTTAWDFARYIGCTRIYFSGLDLGYPSLQTHIRGSTFEEKMHSTSKRTSPAEKSGIAALFGANMITAKDYAGREILTDDRMSLFAWWFSSTQKQYPEIKTSVLSDRSLAIEGFTVAAVQEVLSLKEAGKERCDFLSLTDSPSSRSDFEKRFYEVKDELLSGFNELYQSARTAVKLCEQGLASPRTPSSTQDLIRRLEKIDSSILHSELKEATALVFPTERKLEELFAASKIPADAVSAMFTKSKIIYRELQKGITEYSKFLQDSN